MPYSQRTNTTIEQGSDVWNVANEYAREIFYHIRECDRLIIKAIYGSEEIEEAIQLPSEIKTTLRIQSLNMFINELIIIKDDSYVFYKKADKLIADKLLIRIEEVIRLFPAIYSEVVDSRVSSKPTPEINEGHFNLCLSELRKIKAEMLPLLKNAGLLMPLSDEVDLEKIKHNLVNRG